VGEGLVSYPRLFLQARHHHDRGSALLPHHPPEVPKRLCQWSLGSDVGILLPVAINVVGIDVVASQDTFKRDTHEALANCILHKHHHKLTSVYDIKRSKETFVSGTPGFDETTTNKQDSVSVNS